MKEFPHTAHNRGWQLIVSPIGSTLRNEIHFDLIGVRAPACGHSEQMLATPTSFEWTDYERGIVLGNGGILRDVAQMWGGEARFIPLYHTSNRTHTLFAARP